MLKNYVTSHKRLFISLIIFAGVFCLLGLPFTHWWFYGADDFHALFLAYKTKTWKELLYFFYNGNVGQGAGPSNFVLSLERTSFFSTYYRPIYLVLHALEYWFFGLNAYCFFLVSVFFHACNTVILFNIFLLFTGCWAAGLTALMFAFHPQIAYRFGALVNLHYYVNVFLFLLMFLSFKKYLDTRKVLFYVLACLFFCLSLFTRETTIVLPALIILGMYLYTNSYESYSFGHFFRQLWLNIKLTFGFWLIMFSFLGLRLFLYPLNFLPKFSSEHKSFFVFCKSFIRTLTSKFPEFQVFVYDALSLSWLPWGHKLFRGFLVSLLLLILSYFFIKNTKKIYVLYFLFCTILMLWPAFIGPYSPRYFYEAYPFILIAFIVLFRFYKNGYKTCFSFFIIKKIVLLVFGLVIMGFALFCFDSFARREKKMHIMFDAVYELVKDARVSGRALCFLSWPLESFGEQNAPIFWVLFNDPAHLVYFDSAGAIMQADSNIVTPTRWGNVISDFYDQNYVTISPVKNGFRFVSLNSHKAFFTLDNGGYTVGQKIINKTELVDNQKVVTDFTLIIDRQYLDKNPVYISWDYKLKKFIVIS